ncbi:hypothetical protein BJF92_10860 [Rhizobium rhizosphaerae]|uniref:Uncharacterized protein n=1 Tax=Xaviernesmea rhizosphaerae TaxID=1672749 RepID=A0A1Q9AMG3_9HYPH|nr:hypothetical protein BJF92_10860 [Xaviernesmea rhizosphaerae]OQP88406.1 hypothetical protein BTR14_02970 [Xaviernesmea rhizosphaerae]
MKDVRAFQVFHDEEFSVAPVFLLRAKADILENIIGKRLESTPLPIFLQAGPKGVGPRPQRLEKRRGERAAGP